jgi:hypothetical protein
MTDLRTAWGAEVSDALITGGYMLPRADTSSLVQAIRQLKHQTTGYAEFPVKWNFKDLGRALKRHGVLLKRDQLLKHSEHLRAEALRILRDHRPVVFGSLLMAYSNQKQVLGKTREDIIRFSFSNLLRGLDCIERDCRKGGLYRWYLTGQRRVSAWS